ncbi:MAG: OmpA family protein [Clostridia bacterium]|nr:OmpA family protein [Clostridia bacterium]
MKNTKRAIALLLLVIMLFSVTACGDKKVTTEKAADGTKAKSWILADEPMFGEKPDLDTVFKDEQVNIDVNKIYSSTEFNEKMFDGIYTMYDEDKEIKDIRKMGFKTVEFIKSSEDIVDLPTNVVLGAENMPTVYAEYKNITDKNVAALSFATKDDVGSIPCIYEISGNKIKFNEIRKSSSEPKSTDFETGKAVFEYEFSFKGPYLTLTNSTGSLTLITYGLKKDAGSFTVSGYSLPDSPLIDKLDFFYVSQSSIAYACARDGNYYKGMYLKLTEDGLASVKLIDKDTEGNEFSYEKQFAYILQSNALSFLGAKIVFLDGEKVYYYTDSISSREAKQLDNAGNLTDDQIKQIAEKKSDLFDDLQKEFEEQGINVTVNRALGEIAIDSSVLFGGDSADVSADGKQTINKFLAAYTKVIYNDKYNGFIDKTIVEGHTAPLATSTYESGLPLSTQRAENVKAYCLSAETGVDTSKLAPTLEAVGLSNSKPIYDSNGNVDMDASRRVSFRFTVNVNA